MEQIFDVSVALTQRRYRVKNQVSRGGTKKAKRQPRRAARMLRLRRQEVAATGSQKT